MVLAGWIWVPAANEYGVLTIIGLKLGIVYYWGGDFKFSTQDDTVEPSFPELLGA